MRYAYNALTIAASLDRAAVHILRFSLIVVLVWIGGLKAFPYEADGIIPFVANSPFMSFLIAHPEQYATHMNAEGVLNEANRAWHSSNGTYLFSYALGAVIVTFGVMLSLNRWMPEVAALGSLLVVGMSVVTLSFLVTTPESWVPALGDAQHGFPYLSGRGRLVVKDLIMLGAGLVTLADSARLALGRRRSRSLSHADGLAL